MFFCIKMYCVFNCRYAENFTSNISRSQLKASFSHWLSRVWRLPTSICWSECNSYSHHITNYVIEVKYRIDVYNVPKVKHLPHWAHVGVLVQILMSWRRNTRLWTRGTRIGRGERGCFLLLQNSNMHHWSAHLGLRR